MAVSGRDTPFAFPKTYAEAEPFSKPHTVTVLLALLGGLLYALSASSTESDTATNVKK